MADKRRSDLICRNTLAEELSSLRTTITGLRYGKGVLKEIMEEYRKSVMRIVDEQPTVDAVEVVRCKDCGHSYEGAGERLMCGRCGQNRNGIRLGGVAVKADHFCSYGERRTNERKAD